ncbi:unnamed protein product, partial [marine sediment metagenome]
IGLAIDITERKIAEQKLEDSEKQLRELNDELEIKVLARTEALKRSEEKYKAILDGIITGVWVADKDGTIYYANKGMEKIAGIPSEQLVNANILNDFPKSILQYFRPYYLKARNTLKSVFYDSVSVITPAGRQSFQSGWLIPLTKDGKLYNIICTVEDITERKKSEEKYRDLYEEAPNAYFSIGKDKSIKKCNKIAEKLLGYTREEYSNMKVIDLYANTPDGLTKAKRIFKKFIKGVRIRDEELQMKKKNGDYLWISLSVKSILDEKGNAFESRSMVIDITKRKIAEQKLKESEEKFRTAVENNPDFIVFVKRDGTIFEVNRLVKGYTREMVIGQSVFNEDFYETQDQCESVRKAIMDSLESGETTQCDHSHIAPDGSFASYVTKVSPFEYDDEGRIIS